MSGDLTTEARILEVASRLFYERGYHATTMRDLATGVGIKAASFYNHFSSKQEILMRVCTEGTQAFYDGAITRVEGLEDARERLRALIVWQVSYDARNRYSARVADAQLDALNPQSRADVIEIRDAYDRLLSEVLMAGQEQGHWRIDSLEIVRLGIVGLCTGVYVWYRESGPLTPEEIGEIYASLVLDGLVGSGV